VIYLRSQGLGPGPYGDYQTYGPNLQTFSGVTSLWAHPDDPFPVGSTLNHPDHAAGKQALVAVLAALRRRERTGEGCSSRRRSSRRRRR
jgi:benzylsuccinate CoA-transferase BbsF subunit